MALSMSRQGMARRQQQAVPGIREPIPLMAPVKGWNTRDPYEGMDPQDAVTMDNFQPDYGGIIPREGSQIFDAHGGGSPVTTLAIWRSGDHEQMLAAAGGSIWVVGASVRGAPLQRRDLVPGARDLGSGFTSAWWNTVMFNGRLLLANGRDPIQVYDGTTLAALSIDVDPAPPAGAPVYPPFDSSTMMGLAVIHNLLFMWDGHSPGFWYSSVPYAFQGPILHWFPFDMVTPEGANLLAVNSLTYDGGQGIASYTIFFLSSAEMLIYSGTNPDIPLSEDATTGWALQGNYTVAAPAFGGSVLPRAMTRYGGDIYMISSTDYVKLSQLVAALKEGMFPPRSKASGACMSATAQGKTLNGWQMIYWGGGRRLLVNVPLVAGDPGANNSNFEQHIYSTGLDAWTRYRGLNAYCWCVQDDELFFGTEDGIVSRFGTATADQNPAGAQIPIDCFALQAWNLFGTAHNKVVAAIRPVVRSASAVYYEFGVGFDYNQPDTPIVVEHFGSRTPWNTTPWGAPWERPTATESLWYVAGGDGSAIAIAVHAISDNTEPWIWTRTDFRLTPGIAF
jgi:hypothetical protein